ncbi:MAG: hypothetical protein ABJB10_00880, partial [Mesorhizobium sp.]
MKSSAYFGNLNIIAKLAARRPGTAADLPRCLGPAMQPFARPSIFRHALSRRDGPLKSTKFYYSAKVFWSLSVAAMNMIRTFAFPHDRRPVGIACRGRMQAQK